jgi:hypothetical protein
MTTNFTKTFASTLTATALLIAIAPAAIAHNPNTPAAPATPTTRSTNGHRVAGRDAFLTYQVKTTDALVAAVRGNAALRQRYARHFGVSEAQVVDFIQNALIAYKLPSDRVVTNYGVTKAGYIYPVHTRLKKGTMVWATRSGLPVLKWACSNPLTKTLPGTKMAAKPRTTKKKKTALAPVSEKTQLASSMTAEPLMTEEGPLLLQPEALDKAVSLALAPQIELPADDITPGTAVATVIDTQEDDDRKDRIGSLLGGLLLLSGWSHGDSDVSLTQIPSVAFPQRTTPQPKVVEGGDEPVGSDTPVSGGDTVIVVKSSNPATFNPGTGDGGNGGVLGGTTGTSGTSGIPGVTITVPGGSAVAPEPGSAALLLTGLLGIGGVLVRRRPRI